MKILLTFLALLICFQSSTKADDIKDFEMEGFSVGDSLLDHYNKDEISNALQMKYPKSDKYIKYQFTISNSEYDNISFHLKKNDPRFKIYEISGGTFFNKNFTKCKKYKEKVINDIKSITQNLTEDSYRYYYENVEDGKSYADVVEFKYPNGDLIRMWCVNWSEQVEKNLNYGDNFSISLTPLKHMNWINEEAY